MISPGQVSARAAQVPAVATDGSDHCSKREHILATAAELIALKGFDGMTLDDVRVDASVSKLTIYKHFSSKDALAEEVLVRQLAVFTQRLEQLAEGTPAREALERLIEAVGDASLQRDRFSNFVELLSRVRTRAAREAEDALLATGAALLQRGQAEGSLHRGAEPEMLARLVASAFKDPDFFGPSLEGVARARATLLKLLAAADAAPAAHLPSNLPR